jgi:hypothetical protein
MSDKDAEIEVDDDGEVTVDVTDNPDLAEETPKPEPKLQVQVTQKPDKSAVDDAAAALTAATKTAETERAARVAAEQTAQNERSARLAAEEARRAQEEEAASLRERADNSELTAVTSGIEAAKQQQEAAQREFERAMEAGEFPKASAAQVALSKSAAQIDRLEAEKVRLELAPKRPVTEGRVEAPGNSFDKYVAGFTPRSQAWLRSHPECAVPQVGGDPVKNASMMEGHYAAIRAGYTLESDDYFRTIEEKLGLRTPVSAAAEVTPAVVEPKPTPKPRAQPSAPVNRDVPAASGNRTTRSVTLNKDQREAAKLSFPHLTDKEAFGQYARNLLELEAEGKLGRVTH